MQLKVSLFIILAAGALGCVDIPDFDNTPKIYYNGIDQFTETDSADKKVRENVIITIDFEDGDGDLGASADERSDSSFVRPYGKWGNYELVTARKGSDGKWTESILAEDQYKWMPILKPDGKPGPIKGKLDLNTSFLYGNSTVPVYVRFKVRIRDRALNVSDQIQTDSIQVPGYR
ncbi:MULTISPECIES: hypothetical protein [Dyadobacter]|uniref:Uncharacterized protein n=1 Tax=Dyadobacter chenhuakuii TaxID=2909339 RepID=A0A9X1QBN4_9BACT|nr:MULTISPECIES: hypothetical protein [Dyadobacter]MCE7072038.1 hypothetical protein [Dyadobacter sp. CY327]MCF2494983.1 hypothetical protein [Dyadobacter chenhuakuii]MCF2498061.1 hypothetical protein [Dyadobacter chenhuakuii]MCF2518938.1 hypothetical protein [Dyadobacter sp. CY351]USJ31702.1 hypothetical protein NFI80_02970 [Dyadobacter chenhuakuii]